MPAGRNLWKDCRCSVGFGLGVWEPKEKAEEESCQVPGPDSLEFTVLSTIFACH